MTSGRPPLPPPPLPSPHGIGMGGPSPHGFRPDEPHRGTPFQPRRGTPFQPRRGTPYQPRRGTPEYQHYGAPVPTPHADAPPPTAATAGIPNLIQPSPPHQNVPSIPSGSSVGQQQQQYRFNHQQQQYRFNHHQQQQYQQQQQAHNEHHQQIWNQQAYNGQHFNQQQQPPYEHRQHQQPPCEHRHHHQQQQAHNEHHQQILNQQAYNGQHYAEFSMPQNSSFFQEGQSPLPSLKVTASPSLMAANQHCVERDGSNVRTAKSPPPPLPSSPPPSPPPAPSPSAGRRGKRKLQESEASGVKQSNEDATAYVTVKEFFTTHPPTKPYRFKAGSKVGSIPADKTIPVMTDSGQLVGDGFLEEMRAAHKMNRSWGGRYDECHMQVTKRGPLVVKISIEPEYTATNANVNADLRQLVKWLLKKYGKAGNRPPYVDDLIKRIKRLHTEKDRETSLWIIRNHPAFADPVKRRVFLEEFYIFYKTLSRDFREAFVEDIDLKTCRRWHLNIVRKDSFLSTFYWKGREDKCPADYFVNEYAIPCEEDEDYRIYPFTSEDSYLAIFLRHFIVHGPEAATLYHALLSVSLEEQELIIAHYFEKFLPNFLQEIYLARFEFSLLTEMINTYVARRPVARRSFY